MAVSQCAFLVCGWSTAILLILGAGASAEESCRWDKLKAPQLCAVPQKINKFQCEFLAVLSGVHWNFYPTEEDYRRDARQLIREIVAWLHQAPAQWFDT